MSSLLLQARKIGNDCLEVSLGGEASEEGVPRLEATYAEALAERRHLILNFGACEYVSPDAVAAILAGRELLAGSGLDLRQFGASGVVRPILREAFVRQDEAERPKGRVPGSRRLTPGPAQ